MKAGFRILEIDGLRTLAILAVILVHYTPHSLIFIMGRTGVDLFFVISGFLITGILLDMRADPMPFRKFYWRRMLRIFPPYYATLAVIAVLAALNHEPRLGSYWAERLFFLPAIRVGISFHLIFHRLFGHAPFDLSRQAFQPANFAYFSNGLGVYWSLLVEELFYLLWAPIVLKAPRKLIVWAAILPLFICPILRGFTHTADSAEAGGFITRFDSLTTGACVSLLLRSRPKMLARAFLIPIPILAALLGWLCIHVGLLQGIEISSSELFTIFGFSLQALLFACVVAACVQLRGHASLAVLRWKPVVYIGTISYTMYLIHFTIYAVLAKFLGDDWLRGITAVFLTIGFAALSWKYYETPILHLRDWPFKIPRSNASTSIAARETAALS